MIFFIYGTDAFSAKAKAQELTDQFIKKRDKSGFNVVKLDGKVIDFDQFRQEALTVPFLGESKLIVVENSSRNKFIIKDLAQFLEERGDQLENSLIFIEIFETKKEEPKNALYRLLSKQKYKFSIDLPSAWQAEKWLSDYFKNKNAIIGAPAIKEMTVLVGSDLSQLQQEADKLISYKKGEEIKVVDVKELVKAKFEDDVFKMVDAIVAKNKLLALKLISDKLKSGEAPLAILAMVARQFKIILKIKSGVKNSVGSEDSGLREHPFVISKATEQAKKFSIDELVAINQKIIEIESGLKSGVKNPELMFDMLVMEI